MKVELLCVFLVIIVGLGIISGNSVSKGNFFDNTLDFNTTYHSVYDYSCKTVDNAYCSLTFALRVNSAKLPLTVMDAKDLFVEISLYEQDSRSELKAINIADVYTEQVLSGGEYGGSAFDQSNMAIMTDKLPQVNKTIPYRFHIGMDGCDLSICIEYREEHFVQTGNWFTGLQINIEVQLYIDLNDSFRYQEYFYQALDGELDATNQAKQTVSGFEFLLLLTGIPVIILFRKFYKKLLKR